MTIELLFLVEPDDVDGVAPVADTPVDWPEDDLEGSPDPVRLPQAFGRVVGRVGVNR